MLGAFFDIILIKNYFLNYVKGISEMAEEIYQGITQSVKSLTCPDQERLCKDPSSQGLPTPKTHLSF